jgi:hypothetical protein
MRVDHNGYYGGSLEVHTCGISDAAILDDF